MTTTMTKRGRGVAMSEVVCRLLKQNVCYSVINRWEKERGREGRKKEKKKRGGGILETIELGVIVLHLYPTIKFPQTPLAYFLRNIFAILRTSDA